MTFCLLHNQPVEDGICPTYTGAPDATPCDICCESCTTPMVVDDPTSWPYCPNQECGWKPAAAEVSA